MWHRNITEVNAAGDVSRQATADNNVATPQRNSAHIAERTAFLRKIVDATRRETPGRPNQK